MKECDLTKQNGPITSIAVHPYKSWISVSSKDGTVVVVNTESSEVCVYVATISFSLIIVNLFVVNFPCSPLVNSLTHLLDVRF